MHDRSSTATEDRPKLIVTNVGGQNITLTMTPDARCLHLCVVRIGKSNLVRCANPKCRKVKYQKFD